MFKESGLSDPGAMYRRRLAAFAANRNGNSQIHNCYWIMWRASSFLQQRTQAQRQGPLLSLSAAINNTAGQECERPYDKIYGLLGRTDCQLKTAIGRLGPQAYNIPKMELYLRSLIEGSIQLGPSNQQLDERDVLRLEFGINLLSALQLSPFHPTTAMITLHALKASSGISTDSLALYSALAMLLKNGRRSFTLSVTLSEPRCRGILQLIEDQRKTQRWMPAEGSPQKSEQYKEWVTMKHEHWVQKIDDFVDELFSTRPMYL
ncbi:MAG: hypothetical protein LQ350_008527 [Teloschistes chrysophthalmus]|nr:MAG: hypothetical protein LQ350_008527 [Niorma chrysophthalma]